MKADRRAVLYERGGVHLMSPEGRELAATLRLNENDVEV
jgi:hypothetical protein